MRDLPFYHLIKAIETDSPTYLIKEQNQIIGFFQLKPITHQVFKLDKFVVNELNQTEKLIEIFYHILEFVENKNAVHLLVKTERKALVELLNLLGFKRWPEETNIYGYTYD